MSESRLAEVPWSRPAMSQRTAGPGVAVFGVVQDLCCDQQNIKEINTKYDEQIFANISVWCCTCMYLHVHHCNRVQISCLWQGVGIYDVERAASKSELMESEDPHSHFVAREALRVFMVLC